jgi:pimeloyl-ACP methyl ester carboxylesterase
MRFSPVILLPGIVLPAEFAYGPLIRALGADIEAVAKDLEVYASDEPPEEYSLDLEVAGVLREVDARGWERFHLAGYSGGGAAALAFTARQPDRLLSLTLLEPAWAGNWDLSAAEYSVWREYERLEGLPQQQFMEAFMQMQVRRGVALPSPPSGEPPPWMAKRPAGIGAFMHAFKTHALDRSALERFTRPVYFALGGLSSPDQFGEIAKRLARVFPDFEVEVFEERHHFDPPHRIEPDRLANSLLAVWRRAEAAEQP